jgi:hypothetical protein
VLNQSSRANQSFVPLQLLYAQLSGAKAWLQKQSVVNFAQPIDEAWKGKHDFRAQAGILLNSTSPKVRRGKAKARR